MQFTLATCVTLLLIVAVKAHDNPEATSNQPEVFESTCIVDQNRVNTFDNKIYDIDLGRTWHVQMQYQQQSAYGYTVLVRDNDSDKKDVKLILNDEKNYLEIDMVNSHSAVKVMVNQQQIEFHEQDSYYRAYHSEDDLVQVYALPNGEVKLEANGDFYIIYDGERVQLTIIKSDQFRDEVRGLCGTFGGEQATDFLTPNNCNLRDGQDSAGACFEQEQIYANVEQQNEQHDRQEQDSCTRQQTQVVESDDGETLCFSVRPLPVCREGCKAEKKVQKNVNVHCVKRTNVSELWQKQIQEGDSLDFSHKPTTKTIKMEVAQKCRL